MKKITFLIIALLSFGSIAQDLEFSQFYSNPLYLNPAFAGSNGCPRINLNYRNQWPSLTGNFVSYAAAYDQYFKGLNGGIGVMAVHDQMAGNTINTSSLSLIYSYHLKLGRDWQMLFGAQATYSQKFLNWNNLTFGDMIDPRRGFIYPTSDATRGGSKGFFDVSAGTVVYNEHINFGFSAKHLNEPNESLIVGESKLPMRFTAHASANLKSGKSIYKSKTSVHPSVIFTYQTSPGLLDRSAAQVNYGLYVKHGIFTVGSWFRHKDALILIVGLESDNFRLGYSYDLTVSRLRNGSSGGAHEVSLGYKFNCKPSPRKFKMIDCPSF